MHRKRHCLFFILLYIVVCWFNAFAVTEPDLSSPQAIPRVYLHSQPVDTSLKQITGLVVQQNLLKEFFYSHVFLLLFCFFYFFCVIQVGRLANPLTLDLLKYHRLGVIEKMHL